MVMFSGSKWTNTNCLKILCSNLNACLTNCLASFVFSWLHFLFSHFFFTLNFSKHVLYMFLYMLVKHVVDIQALFLQEKWEKFAILSLVYGSMGHRDRSIWSQEQCINLHIVFCWVEVCRLYKFRKWTRMKYITFKILCEKIGMYFNKKKLGLLWWCKRG